MFIGLGLPIVSRQPYGLPALDTQLAGATALDSRVTFTRSGNATYRDSTGARQTAGTNVARFDHDASGNPLGLLIEGARTNSFLNSDAPATHTSPSLGTATYTLWIEGTGSVAVVGNTATITGAGTATEGSPVTFTVTGAGTVDFTVTGDVDIAQCENGAFSSSYIPTEGSAATRNADVATVTDLGWFNASEGTLFVEASTPVLTGAAQVAVSLDNETLNERIQIYLSGGISNADGRLQISDGGATQAQIIGSGTLVAGQVYKLAAAWKANDAILVRDGTTVGTDTSVTLPTVTRILLGDQPTSSAPLFGHLRRVVYWPRRLPDDALQNYTA